MILLLCGVAAAAPAIDVKDSSGWTALQRAAEGGDLAQIKSLLKSGANLEASDPKVYSGATAFVIALEFSQHDAAVLLLDRGASSAGATGSEAMALAARGGFDDVVDALVARKVAVTGTHALHLAAKYGHVSTIGKLIAAGAVVDDPERDDHDFTPLIIAASEGQTAAVKALLDAGAKAEQHDGDGTTALHWAVYAARPAEKHIYRALDQPHDTVWTPRKDAPVVSLLVSRGAKLDTVDLQGNTALHEAAMLDCEAAAKVLVAAGADRRIKNADGKTAYDLARDRKNSVEPVLKP